MRRTSTVLGIALIAILVAACTRAPAPARTGLVAPPEATETSGSPEPTTDEVTPLIVSTVDDPIPVWGSDGKYHVAYELEILNFAPREATLTSLQTMDPVTGDVTNTMDHDAIVAASIPVGSLPAEPRPAKSIPPGGTVIVLLDDTYDNFDAIPDPVTHEIKATFAPPGSDQGPFAGDVYPSKVAETTGATTIGIGEPLTIAAPIEGKDWVAVNACCTLTPHRGAMLSMNGRVVATERFAIDWIQIEPDRFKEAMAHGLLPSFIDDSTRNESYLAFDEPLLAVADGTVVRAVDGRKDVPPQGLPEGLILDEFGGNYIILDLGEGFYAFYAHIEEGTIAVKQGDEVKAGDVIAHLGNSGNSSEAHLHFHIMRGPTPLASTNWPFVIDNFDLRGTLSNDGFLEEPAPQERADAMVMVRNVTDFPQVTAGG